MDPWLEPTKLLILLNVSAADVESNAVPDDGDVSSTVAPAGNAVRSSVLPDPAPTNERPPPVPGATNVVDPDDEPTNRWMPEKVSEPAVRPVTLDAPTVRPDGALLRSRELPDPPA